MFGIGENWTPNLLFNYKKLYQLNNPTFEFIWIGKFRIYSMDCGCGDWFFVFFCECSHFYHVGQKRIFCKTSAWRKFFFFFWLRGFRNEDPCKAIYELNPSFISKKKNLNPSHRKFRIHTREKEGVSWRKEIQELCKLVQEFSCFLFVNITKNNT